MVTFCWQLCLLMVINKLIDVFLLNKHILNKYIVGCDQERIKLSELEVVSLTRDKFTSSRRSNAIEQVIFYLKQKLNNFTIINY